GGDGGQWLAPDDRRLLGLGAPAARPFAARSRRARAGGRSPRRRGACEPAPSRESGSRHGRRRQAGRRHLALDDLRQSLKPFYSQMGRPSVDPELMIRMLIVGYCMGIRSERRLCDEVHLNLAYRWFCRLGLDGRVPDHSTFSKNRHGRFRESDMLRRLFESVVQRCIAEGLVSADGFAVDASLIAADANKQRSVPSREWKPDEIKENAVRAAREYLATLDNAAFGAASPVTPKFISRSDPAAQWTGAHKGHAFFATPPTI